MPVADVARVRLPDAVAASIVNGMVDFDADGQPDGVLTEVCCESPREGACDYTCRMSHLRSDDGWISVMERMSE